MDLKFLSCPSFSSAAGSQAKDMEGRRLGAVATSSDTHPIRRTHGLGALVEVKVNHFMSETSFLRPLARDKSPMVCIGLVSL